MENTNDQIIFNFSYFALRLLGKGLYTNVWTAISELAANGFDAEAKTVRIYINSINKEQSTIEIFDDGYGMDYQALSEKYALIGKDKRDDESIDEETKKKLMGRKGIGKLAALYLSNKYYLISKTKNEESAWCLDASSVKDSDIPRLDRKNVNEIKIDAKKEWKSCKTGTMIKLTNVNLTNFGTQSLAGLKARLSNFFLLDALDGKMELAYITNRSQQIVFEKIEKFIAYKNICAFYNNTMLDYTNVLAKGVYFPSSLTFINEKKREIVIIDKTRFPDTSGEKCFIQIDGTKSNPGIPYDMTGWIGIHTTINNDDAKNNDKRFIKNKVYTPNKLRLYVRKKLAVDNFLDYIRNTQAFSNYIEGEISFDVLDDNRLPDIATSSRQGYAEIDDRVQLLIEILKPIITSLIRERIKFGNLISTEEKAYNADQTKKQELAKIKAEAEKKKAERERDQAQADKEQTEEKLNATKEILSSEQKRSSLLIHYLSADQLAFAKRFHLVKINVETIKQLISTLIKEKNRDRFSLEKLWDYIKAMSFCIERIKANLSYGMNANFNTEDESIKADLFDFISEYSELILEKAHPIHILIIKNAKAIITFTPQNIGVILENIVSNSCKANSSTLIFRLGEENDYYLIDAIDDGDGIDRKKITDLDSLFDFGKSFTRTGSGIGLYHIKEIIEKNMHGKISINENTEKGFEINIRIKK
jgi:signal transduction histidine kinase